MELTLESLHRDHDNLRRILFLLEDLLIDIYRGSHHHNPVFQQILAYIQDYPERVHHPTEDMIYSLLYKKGFSDDKLRKNLNSLLKDHSEIENITRDTISIVERMQVDTYLDSEDFGTKISDVIKRQRAHLLFEEMHIYPQIAKYLDDEDWAEIATRIPAHEDPIFGSRIRKEYELIVKAL